MDDKYEVHFKQYWAVIWSCDLADAGAAVWHRRLHEPGTGGHVLSLFPPRVTPKQKR